MAVLITSAAQQLCYQHFEPAFQFGVKAFKDGEWHQMTPLNQIAEFGFDSRDTSSNDCAGVWCFWFLFIQHAKHIEDEPMAWRSPEHAGQDCSYDNGEA